MCSLYAHLAPAPVLQDHAPGTWGPGAHFQHLCGPLLQVCLQEADWATDVQTSRPEDWSNGCCGRNLDMQSGFPHMWGYRCGTELGLGVRGDSPQVRE